jgi:hypothetical protein
VSSVVPSSLRLTDARIDLTGKGVAGKTVSVSALWGIRAGTALLRNECLNGFARCHIHHLGPSLEIQQCLNFPWR